MDARELRLGNYIIGSDDKPHQITKFDTNKVWFEKITNQHGVKCWLTSLLSECKPIPLTEELLVKCGFDTEPNFGQISFDPFMILGVIWTINGVSAWLEDIESEETVCVHFHNRPLYLHTLQNIYFALTGKDLTINL